MHSKVEEICNECPTLTTRFLADGELPGWASFPYELLYPAPVSHRSVSIPDQPDPEHRSDADLFHFRYHGRAEDGAA
jgi:hypothetical protein